MSSQVAGTSNRSFRGYRDFELLLQISELLTGEATFPGNNVQSTVQTLLISGSAPPIGMSAWLNRLSRNVHIKSDVLDFESGISVAERSRGEWLTLPHLRMVGAPPQCGSDSTPLACTYRLQHTNPGTHAAATQ